jgi:hypothetical protein
VIEAAELDLEAPAAEAALAAGDGASLRSRQHDAGEAIADPVENRHGLPIPFCSGLVAMTPGARSHWPIFTDGDSELLAGDQQWQGRRVPAVLLLTAGPRSLNGGR